MLNFLLMSDVKYLSDVVEPFAIWGTVAIVGVLAIAWLMVFFVNRNASGKVAKNMLAGFVFYALALGVFLLILEINKKFDSAYLEDNYVSNDIVSHVFIPLLIATVLTLACAVTLFVLAKKKSPALTVATYICSGLIAVAVIVSVIMIYKFYSANVVDDGYYTDEDYGKLNNLALYISASLLVIGSIVAGFILGNKDGKGFDTKCISTAGICVALSFTLSYVKLFELPYGGSVTLFSMLPVMLFAYVYGIKKGLVLGLLYGMLQAIQDPFIVHPAQFLLDYPIAFAMLGYAGSLTRAKALSNKPRLKFTLSAIIAGTLRWLCHVLSGVFAFGAYALDAVGKSEGVFSALTPSANPITNFWLYSTVYNGYVFVDVLLVIIVGFVIFSSTSFKKELAKLNPAEK